MILQATFNAKAINEPYGKEPEVTESSFTISETQSKQALLLSIPSNYSCKIELDLETALDLQEGLKTFIDRMAVKPHHHDQD